MNTQIENIGSTFYIIKLRRDSGKVLGKTWDIMGKGDKKELNHWSMNQGEIDILDSLFPLNYLGYFKLLKISGH